MEGDHSFSDHGFYKFKTPKAADRRAKIPGVRMLQMGMQDAAQNVRDGQYAGAAGNVLRGAMAGSIDAVTALPRAVGRAVSKAGTPLGQFASALATGDPERFGNELDAFTGAMAAPAATPDQAPAASTRALPASAMSGALEGELMPSMRGTGSIAFADGRVQQITDDYGANVNTFDMQGANAEFAKANRIRQQTIDAQPQGAGIVIPGADPVQDVYERARALMEDARNAPAGPRRSGLIRSAQLLSGQGDTLAGLQGGDRRNATTLASTQQNNAAAMARENASNRNALMRQILGDNASMQRTERRGENQLAYARAQGGGPQGLSPSDFRTLLDTGLVRQTDDGEIDLEDPQTLALYTAVIRRSLGGEPELGFANGGLVPGYADGGMISTGPTAPAMPELQGYQAYARSAMEKGLDPVEFSQFLTMQGAAGQRTTAIGMADGGEVPGPDASGKMVVDSNPAAPTDSIPAMIDGKQPAKLDSGEFVIPRDVVQFFGTDKLNKMIAQARKPADGGQPQGAAGVSAIGAAQAAG